MKKFLLFLILIANLVFGQTSRFERYFADANGAKIGSTIYIVHEVTGDSLLLTEVNSTSKPGIYRRTNVAYGMYKVYIDGVKETENIFFSANREYEFIEAVDSDGDNIIELTGIEKTSGGKFLSTAYGAGTVDSTALASGEIDSTHIQNGGVSYTDMSDDMKARIQPGSGSYPPDGVTVKFKISGGDTTLELMNDNSIFDASYGIKTNIVAVEDTNSLKLRSGNIGDICYLYSLSAYDSVGSGFFVNSPFSNYNSGLQFGDWVRYEYLNYSEVNVKWFGARGDSTDASLAFQKAIAALPLSSKTKGILRVPQGKYITSQLDFTNSGTVIFKGDGPRNTYIYSTETDTAAIIACDYYSAFMEFRDFTLYQADYTLSQIPADSSDGNYAFLLNEVGYQTIISNVDISYFQDDAIKIIGRTGPTLIENCSIQFNTGFGISMDFVGIYAPADVRIVGGNIHQSWGGIHLNGGYSLKVDNIDIELGTPGRYPPFYVSGQAFGATVTDATFSVGSLAATIPAGVVHLNGAHGFVFIGGTNVANNGTDNIRVKGAATFDNTFISGYYQNVNPGGYFMSDSATNTTVINPYLITSTFESGKDKVYDTSTRKNNLIGVSSTSGLQNENGISTKALAVGSTDAITSVVEISEDQDWLKFLVDGNDYFADAATTARHYYVDNNYGYRADNTSGTSKMLIKAGTGDETEIHSVSENGILFKNSGNTTRARMTGPGVWHFLGNICVGDTLSSIGNRYLYFSTDGSLTSEYIRWEEATGRFYFSDSIVAEGYIDYSETFEGNGIDAIKNIAPEKDSKLTSNYFKELDHNTLPGGVMVTWNEYQWVRNGIKMPKGWIPNTDPLKTKTVIDTVFNKKTKKTEYNEKILIPSKNDSLNYIGNCDLIVSQKQGRNISRMINVLVKCNKELIEKIDILENKILQLESN